MVKATSVYNKEIIKEINKPMEKKSIITSSIFSVLMLGLGVFTIVETLVNEFNVFNVILGGITTLISFYPIYRAVKQNKANLEQTVKDLNVEQHPVTINYVFKEKRIEVELEQNGEVKKDTILIRNVTKVRKVKTAVAIYVGEQMYYIKNEDITVGDADTLVRMFLNTNAKIMLK